MGAGGKGLYALDVSDPNAVNETTAAAKIKWEITSATTGYSNLGYTYGTPRIARLNNNTAVAIVGNGYMNAGGHAVLYLINVDNGTLNAAIDTGYGSASSPNGLSTPALFDSNSDGKVDYAYAGDLDGHIFKFDLSGATVTTTLLFTTNPAQPITSPPAVIAHPSGGRMVVFATGQLLTTGDIVDATTVHYAYGIWDGAPIDNNTLLTQALSTNFYGTDNVRTITANVPNWTAGNVNHFGWKVSLPPGERVTGELPFEKNGRFYFLTANPAVVNTPPLPNGSNWMYELDMISGGSVSNVFFDLNFDGKFDSLDLVTTGCTTSNTITCIPIAKPVGAGVDSQPRYVEAASFNTTLFTNHPDTLSSYGSSSYDPGVSGGHFDFDNYFFNTGNVTTYTPTNTIQTKQLCSTSTNLNSQLGTISTGFCNTNNNFGSDYTYLKDFNLNSNSGCSRKQKKYNVICSTTTSTTTLVTGTNYAGPRSTQKTNQLHEHEYDDTYDVTGVNMLNASNVKFNLSEMLPNTSTQFKVLVMNQYLSPAAKISVGGEAFVSVKTYKNLASQTDAQTLLSNLPIYTRNNVTTLIVNLPLDAFKSKDWWNGSDIGNVRAGLIPTLPGCVYYVNPNGSMLNDISKLQGLIGPNGERFDGALTIQLIKSNTPASALELNFSNTGTIKNGNGTSGIGRMSDSDRVRYGWRVNVANFGDYVLGEYTMYWHHNNNICYGRTGWVADAPEDTTPSSCTKSEVICGDLAIKARATRSADPTDGIFAMGLAVKSDITTATTGVGSTRTITYVDNTVTTIITVISGGAIITTTTVRGGVSTNVTSGVATTVGSSSVIKGAEEKKTSDVVGRQSWWEIFQ